MPRAFLKPTPWLPDFPICQALLTELGPDDGRRVYRIRIGGIGPDPRLQLRRVADVTERDLSEIALRLERWDRAKASPGWHRRVLRLIADNPATLAARLAAKASCDKAAFKRDVRKLKELGLTESLEVGYRLSPRGKAVLAGLETAP